MRSRGDKSVLHVATMWVVESADVANRTAWSVQHIVGAFFILWVGAECVARVDAWWASARGERKENVSSTISITR